MYFTIIMMRPVQQRCQCISIILAKLWNVDLYFIVGLSLIVQFCLFSHLLLPDQWQCCPLPECIALVE